MYFCSAQLLLKTICFFMVSECKYMNIHTMIGPNYDAASIPKLYQFVLMQDKIGLGIH